MTVRCYYCDCPVEFNDKMLIERFGVTLQDCEQRNLYVVCNMCWDMMELECNTVVVLDETQFVRYMRRGRQCHK